MKRAFVETMNKEMEVELVERTTNPSGVCLVNPAKIAKKSPEVLSELAMEIGKSDILIKANAKNKLQVIAKQMKYLEEETQKILEKSKQDYILHHAACNFCKVPGHFYHLYKKESGQLYFGMLSPSEWSPPHEYQGTFRLESDQSWTKLENIDEEEEDMKAITYLISKHIKNNHLSIIDTPMDT